MRRIDRVLTLVLSLILNLVLSLFAAPAFAQGRVTGVVKDQDGHPVKGASVTAENKDVASSTFTATTGAKGQFAMLGLRGGVWTFTVQAPGFETARTRAPVKVLAANPPFEVRLQRVMDATQTSSSNLDPRPIQRRLDAAAALEASGRLDEAIEVYRDILARAPALTTLHLQLGYLFERKRDTAGAIAEYQAVLKSDAVNKKALAALARLSRE